MAQRPVVPERCARHWIHKGIREGIRSSLYLGLGGRTCESANSDHCNTKRK